jgi:NTE family protein
MDTRKIAIACQGGGIHGAFTCGVLNRILKAKEDEENGIGDTRSRRRFEIYGLSGTSAGALNAFMVWYGMMLKEGQKGGYAEAREAVNNLWDTFQVRKNGEWGINLLGQQAYKLQDLGIDIRPQYPPYFSDWLAWALRQWSAAENLIGPKVDFGEVRPEFYDFASLLRTCAPEFPRIQERMEEIAKERTKPRLLIGAVEILSGEFEAFDSFMKKVEEIDPKQRQDLRNRTEEEARRRISYEAVEASGTLPEIRRSQSIPGLKNIEGQDVLYWDGLYSQNPPVCQFVGDTPLEDVPDEIWVIRINPQRRNQAPLALHDIDDRRNELSGNLSLNQELTFIQAVNGWVREDKERTGFAKNHKEIDIYMITMAKHLSESLDLGSKMNRDPAFVSDLRKHGDERAADFLDFWSTAAEHELEKVKWPTRALEGIQLHKSQRTTQRAAELRPVSKARIA